MELENPLLAFHQGHQADLPWLTSDNYRQTSSIAWEYNCIAWAVGVTNLWWWPIPGRYWPAGVAREETISAFIAAFATVGYAPTDSSLLENGVEKVALYAINQRPTHAARQLVTGVWTSKMGPNIDIEHDTVEVVAGGIYGEVVAFLGRNRVC
jgi:hypothetical protein